MGANFRGFRWSTNSPYNFHPRKFMLCARTYAYCTGVLRYMSNSHTIPHDRYREWISSVATPALAQQILTDTGFPYVFVDVIASYARFNRIPLHYSASFLTFNRAASQLIWPCG